ncbi:MAG: GNAT family N-acetyltransferase [Lachnospiraceae bacterium]|nr:GNAT family N-acetyltransferase [Lachnospiraceae bacterium]
MICGRYYLGLDHMEEIAPIRREVFGVEQGWHENILFDETDETAVQAVVYKDMNRTIPVGVGRLYKLEAEGDFKIGRIAVKKEERGQGYGDFIVRMLVDKGLMMGADRVLVGAQPHAIAFYEKIGFRSIGETYTEAGILHTVMEIRQNTVCKACQGHKEN